ncbi:MAG: FtsX-like permease family protein, partial [Ilumatobacter sp.]
PGAVLLGLGMFGDAGSTSATLGLVGVGGALTFIGVSMLSALFAGPVTSGLGLPVAKVKGVTGQLARGNASRNPQRTSATATALMIGLALISGVAVLTQSILDTFNDILEDSISADLFIFESNQGLEFSAALVDQLQPLPEVADVSGFSTVQVRIDGEVRSATGFDSGVGTSVVDFGVIEGVAEIGPGGLGVLDDAAAETGLQFEDGFITDIEVRAIFDDASVLDGRQWLLDRSLTSEHVTVDDVSFIGLTYTEGVDTIFARSVVEEVTSAFPQLSVQDNTEFKEEAEGQIAQLQVVITGLLVLCLVVAFFGIVNTMALAVLERTREIGLLRAVGMTRRQLRTSVRWEAAIISLFGSLLGIALGLVLGAAAVVAIPDSFVSSIGIPWGQLVVYALVGGGLGVLAAWFPARRAAKLDVLDAIATE